eukprot:Awhi_evm1s5508
MTAADLIISPTLTTTTEETSTAETLTASATEERPTSIAAEPSTSTTAETPTSTTATTIALTSKSTSTTTRLTSSSSSSSSSSTTTTTTKSTSTTTSTSTSTSTSSRKMKATSFAGGVVIQAKMGDTHAMAARSASSVGSTSSRPLRDSIKRSGSANNHHYLSAEINNVLHEQLEALERDVEESQVKIHKSSSAQNLYKISLFKGEDKSGTAKLALDAEEKGNVEEEDKDQKKKVAFSDKLKMFQKIIEKESIKAQLDKKH